MTYFFSYVAEVLIDGKSRVLFQYKDSHSGYIPIIKIRWYYCKGNSFIGKIASLYWQILGYDEFTLLSQQAITLKNDDLNLDAIHIMMSWFHNESMRTGLFPTHCVCCFPIKIRNILIVLYLYHQSKCSALFAFKIALQLQASVTMLSWSGALKTCHSKKL